MSLNSANRSVRVGEVTEVPVYLYAARNVANINFDLSYDPKVITAVDEPIKGNILSSSSIFAGSSKEKGVVHVGFAGTKGVNGNGTVTEVRFQAVGKPGDKSPLRLKVTKIGDPSGNVPEILLVSGEVTIVNASGLQPGDGDGDGKVTTLDDCWPCRCRSS